MRNRSLTAILLASTIATGCAFENTAKLLTPTAPSGDIGAPASPAPTATTNSGSGGSTGATGPAVPATPAASGFSGTWGSPAIAGLPIGNCSDLQWSISSQTENSVSGTVSAVCTGGTTITATITGQMNGSDTVNLTANGSAVALGLTCPFALTGVGTRVTADSMRLDYQGTTCFGRVNGSEMLQRRSPAPAPAPPPTPEPEPAAPESPPPPRPQPIDVLFGCGDLPAGRELVRCIHNHIKPTDEFSGFEVTKRVAWALRNKGGGGLLLKPGGDNIVTWRGYTFSASRIMYPNGQLYKVLSDVGRGGANGPVWLDDGTVERNRYVPALDPALR